jgi:hypothetical protein
MFRLALLSFVSVCGLLAPALACANVEHRFSGFATLGLVSNTNEALVFRRDVSQDDGSYDGSIEWKNDSLIGAQWDGRWNHQIETSVQLVAKERFNSGIEESLEWAFVRYRPFDGVDLRLGRMGADIFMLSDYRQVGYAYPWARPPHDFYGLLSIFHIDGVDLAKRIDLNGTTLTLRGFYGNHDQKFPVGVRSEAHSRLDFNAGGLSLIAERDSWKLRYTYADIRINNNATGSLVIGLDSFAPYWPEAAALADMAATYKRHFSYHDFGISYDNNTWWVQAEYSSLNSEIGVVPQSDRAYLSIGRRFDQLSLYALTGRSTPRNRQVEVEVPTGLPDPWTAYAAQLAQITEASLNGVRINQSSVGAGVRWDFAAKMALKLQVEEFRIDADGTNLWLRADPRVPITTRQQARVTSLTWDILF